MHTMEHNWYTVNEALDILGISRRTLYDRMDADKLESKKEGKNRMIWIDDDVKENSAVPVRGARTDSHTDSRTDSHTDETVKLLTEQLEYFRKQTEMLQGQLSEQSQQLSEQSQRHDTIMLKMTNAIENQQLQLQEVQNQKSVGFWKRIFGMP